MSLTSFGETQPSLAWTFESSNVDYVTNLTPSAQVSPGPAQLVGSATLVTTVAGVSNTAVYFPGTTSTWMNLGTSTPINFDTSLSNIFMECWVYSSRAYNPTFITWHQGASGGQENWSMYFDTAGTLYTSIWGDVAGTATQGGTAVSSAIPQNTWTHVGFAIANTASVYKTYIYVNGAPTSTTPPVGWVPKFYAAGTTQIGGRNTSGDLTNMYIRDLRVVQGGVVPTTNFTPLASAPFSYASPTYVANMGTTVFTLLGQFITYVPGKYGSAVSIQNFIGASSGNKQISYPVSFDMQNLTVSLWTNLRTVSGSDLEYLVFFSSSPATGYLYLSVNSTNGRISCVARGDDGGTTYSASTSSSYVTAGTWYNIVAVLSNGSLILLYINGSLITTRSYSSSQILTSLNIGASGNRGMDGLIDDLRIYNTALSAAQVQSIYQAQGMPSRGVAAPTPIQPGYIYELDSNKTNVGTPNVAIINASNPDPRIYLGDNTTRIDQWNTVPNLLTLWDTTPFKYYMIFLTGGYTYPVNIPTSGTYQIDILFVGPGGGVDSFFIHMDSDSDTISTSAPSYPTSFIWLTALTKTLTAGAHTVQISAREPSGLAAIRVIPTGGPAPTLSVSRLNMSGAPLFNQLSQSAASSAVGAFSLRAVNGVTAKAVQVRPQGQFPPGPMTANSTPNIPGYSFGGSGTYTASSSTGTAWSAFDYNTSTFWQTTGSPSNLTYETSTLGGDYIGSASTTVDGSSVNGEWIQIQLPIGVVIASYSMYARSGFLSRMARNFTIAGSNDNGASWTTVDTETNQTSWVGQTPITFTVTSSTAYTYYRLIVTAVVGQTSGNERLNIAGLTYFGTPSGSETDFYADERGNLLTAPVVGTSLQNWLGGATGYVTKWYDQTGKGNDANQDAAANQPIIQRATKGPGYMVNFNGTSQFVTLSASHNFLNGTNITVNAVALRTATVTGSNYIIGTNSPTVSYQRFFLGFNSDTSFAMPVTGNPPAITIPAYNASSEPVTYMTGGLTPSRVLYRNDTLGGTNADTTLLSVPSGYSYSIGYTVGAATYYYQGNLFELLIFTSALNQAQVTQIYQNQLSYTGT